MKCHLANRKSGAETPEEQMAERQRMADMTVKVMKVLLRLLRPMLGDLPDPRDQRYVTYPKEALFLYGVMMFALRAMSRRDANMFMTEPVIQENLRKVMPGLEAVPHGDTLGKYLRRIDTGVIQRVYWILLKKMLRGKEFRSLTGRMKVLVDGSGKGSRDWCYSVHALHRKLGKGDVWMTYVLDAVLVLENGMVIPLCTEFLENTGAEFDKQDCEAKAWSRMAPVLRRLVGGDAVIIFDGLYASGPVIRQCRRYGWDYIITLKDGSMPVFAEDAHGIMMCEPASSVESDVDGRHQHAEWANGVEHVISANHTRINLNVVRMTETWTERHPVTGKPDGHKKVVYQFISSVPLDRMNAMRICWLGRKRWLIENFFKTEKKGGYGFEHFFSMDWEVNMAYHYFMKFGHFINVLLMSSEELSQLLGPLGGISGFLKKMRMVFSGALLDADSIKAAASRAFRLRFNTVSFYLLPVPPP